MEFVEQNSIIAAIIDQSNLSMSLDASRRIE